MEGPAASKSDELGELWVKVPVVTASFWVIKVLTTGMGETTSDFLFQRFAPVIALALGTTAFVVALVLQFQARRYVPWIYWLAVAMVSVFGTIAADVMHVGFGVPYIASTLFFLLALAVIFFAWYRSERTLSMHSIFTRRREGFYWATVLATFALGTATGDLTAKTLHLGYLASGIVFVIVFAIPALAYWRLGLNAIVAFWAAYVVTRPVGASFGDWLALPRAWSGLGVGTGTISIGLGVMVLALVVYTARSARPERGGEGVGA